jgi:hypothetical protein
VGEPCRKADQREDESDITKHAMTVARTIGGSRQ